MTTMAPTPEEPGFDVILGNPPFLNQLETATATARGLVSIVRLRSGDAIRGYTDLSATFFLFSTHIVRRGGRIVLVQPQSLLAAKDASSVRREVLRIGRLESLWVSNEHVFPGAAVYTCAPTIHIGGPDRAVLHRSTTGKFTPLAPIQIVNRELAQEDTWAHLTADASGIPDAKIVTTDTLSSVADATADFRDQYYGLDGFLVDDGDLPKQPPPNDADFPLLITTGLIDLAACHWGRFSTRVLKSKWQAPRIDRARMVRDGTLGHWLTTRMVPKLLIATQTRVVEVLADDAGRLVPSVPVLTVTPHDASQLWHIAAAIASPVCTAIAMRKYAGAALSTDAIKLSAKQVLQLPLPVPSPVWDAAAAHFRAATGASKEPDRLAALRAMAEATIDAFQVPPDQREPLLSWWWARLTSTSSQEDSDEHA
jgi:hypothetical protein